MYVHIFDLHTTLKTLVCLHTQFTYLSMMRYSLVYEIHVGVITPRE
jgi:hypothetical protein